MASRKDYDFTGLPVLEEPTTLDQLREASQRLAGLRKLVERSTQAMAAQERIVETLTEEYVAEGVPHF